MQVDAQAVSALIEAAHPQRGVHLVGHSYGGAVAMQIALNHPQRVRSLTLYEPVAFGALRALAPGDRSLTEITDVAHSVRALVQRGETDEAAARFVSYWGGEPAWTSLSASQRATVAQRMPNVPRHFDACFAAAWGRDELARLVMPTLLLHGARTRAPARRVAELLAQALPQVQHHELAGAGHLGPMTHEATVTQWMSTYLDPALANGSPRVAMAA